MNLYEINLAIENCFDPETGEILEDKMAELEESKEAKIESIALYIKNKNALITAIKEEEKSLKARRESLEKEVERLQNYLTSNMDVESKFETPKVKVSFRHSTTCEVDESLVPKKWFTKVVTKKLDKAGIKKLLQDGKKVKGASLVEHFKIQVK